MPKDLTKVSVVGLGYVGLPLALALSKKFNVTGFDINSSRIKDLGAGLDQTLEVSASILKKSKNLSFSSDKLNLKGSSFYFVTVPTPIDLKNLPDLSALESACKIVGSNLEAGQIVVFESTVYPGCTREICVPLLEKYSGLKFNKHFFCGYSPERINPGDSIHSITKIPKVVSGSNKTSLKKIYDLYNSIIDAEIHKADSLEIAEAAKIIENTQRDLNIALINEFSIILKKMNIPSKKVMSAAATKWNFHQFSPGFVGGHCIGVDPYYLTYKAQSLGINPEVILAGRNLNDRMPSIVGQHFLSKFSAKSHKLKIVILGATFKENCPDIRNSKVADLITYFNSKHITPYLFDPYLPTKPNFSGDFHFLKTFDSSKQKFDGLFIAVNHTFFKKQGKSTLKNLLKKDGIFFDFKSTFANTESESW
jgi:UDP-N-acetyl-D-glucosamine/UDP-N-acetyl-D-galactosamine dehydrogenase